MNTRNPPTRAPLVLRIALAVTLVIAVAVILAFVLVTLRSGEEHADSWIECMRIHHDAAYCDRRR